MDRLLIRRLYEDFGPALVLYARSLLGDGAAAEDVVQQVFVKLLEGRVPAPTEPKPYLYRAVRNAALNARRDEGRRRPWPEQEPAFEAAPGREDEREELEKALEGLPQEQRETVVMKVWGGMTFEEIAALAGVSLNTAASRYRYGMEKLRERLAAWTS